MSFYDSNSRMRMKKESHPHPKFIRFNPLTKSFQFFFKQIYIEGKEEIDKPKIQSTNELYPSDSFIPLPLS